MPLHTHRQPLPLTNEMTERDFNWMMGDSFQPNFTSPAVPAEFASIAKSDLASFINESLRGPFYVQERPAHHRGAKVEVLDIVLLHPDDRCDFARRFLSEHWHEHPCAARQNAAVIAHHTSHDFSYQSEGMESLKGAIRSLGPMGPPRLCDIDTAARNLWPASASHPVSRARSMSFT